MCEWSFLNLLWLMVAGLFFGFGFAAGSKLFGRLLG
jgi:hypothetical protein